MDISYMSYSQLTELKGVIESHLVKKKEMELKDLCTKITEIVSDSPFSLPEVLDELTANKPKRTAPAKYRNPENPDETWTGRGRKPEWVVALLETGRGLDECAV